MTMFTETFTLERHLEELRAELRGTIDPQEASDIRAELLALERARVQVSGDAPSES
jgi:hypothetical protein